MKKAIALILLISIATLAIGQRWQRRFVEGGIPARNGLPTWEIDKTLPKDTFTFVRVIYDSHSGRYGRVGGPQRWAIDYPDADINFSYRLKEMTSLNVDPNGKTMRMTNPEIFNYPFLYIVEPGSLSFSEEERQNLRRHLLNGGFLMFDDFWGERDYENLYFELKQVFPEYEPQELELDHPIFNIVFPIKEKPQIPNVGVGTEHQWTGRTWESQDSKTVHYKGIYDDKGRMMVLICHNTDLGDGWEREGDNIYYFKEFSEKRAYPLGINIVFYAMTQ